MQTIENAEVTEDLLKDGEADLIGVGRAVLKDSFGRKRQCPV